MSEEIDQKTCVIEESLEQLIKVQTETAKEYCLGCIHIDMCCWYPYEGCAFREIVDYDHRAGRWIPTTEGLPWDGKKKLVTCISSVGGIRRTDSASYKDGHWHGSRPMVKVIAWMDPPDPYMG